MIPNINKSKIMAALKLSNILSASVRAEFDLYIYYIYNILLYIIGSNVWTNDIRKPTSLWTSDLSTIHLIQ